MWTTLGEIGEIVTGNTPSKDNKEYYGGNIPFFKPTDLEQGIDTKFSNDKLSQLGFESSRKLPANTVLVTCIGATIGKTGLISVEGSCNQQINAIVPTKSIIPYFLYYACVSEYMQNEIKSNASATTLPILNKGNFSKIAFPLPPLEEQKRIVSEIERWMLFVKVVKSGKSDLQKIIIQAKSKILDLAIHGKLVPQDPNDEPASELLKRINPKAEITCDNPQYGKLPSGWCLTEGKYLYKPMKSAKPKGLAFNYIDIDSIDNTKQRIDSVKVVKTENAPSRASRYTQKGDIVFSMVRPYLKNIAMIPDNDCIASTGFYVCSPSDVAVDKYCYYLMISDYTVNGLNQYMKGDNSPSINKGDIDSWLFPIPPLQEQHRIVAKIEELFAQLDKIEASL